MPHQCTNCGRTFADGSKEMLSGCPDCGGNKFQFAPATAATADSSDGAVDSEPGTADADGVGGTTAGETASSHGPNSGQNAPSRQGGHGEAWSRERDNNSPVWRCRSGALLLLVDRYPGS